MGFFFGFPLLIICLSFLCPVVSFSFDVFKTGIRMKQDKNIISGYLDALRENVLSTIGCSTYLFVIFRFLKFKLTMRPFDTTPFIVCRMQLRLAVFPQRSNLEH